MDPVAVDIAPVADPAGGLVYTGGRERVYAFDTTSGSLRWMLDTADGSSSSPVLLTTAAGVVYGASQFSTTSAITL